jgi:hypothetical protein
MAFDIDFQKMYIFGGVQFTYFSESHGRNGVRAAFHTPIRMTVREFVDNGAELVTNDLVEDHLARLVADSRLNVDVARSIRDDALKMLLDRLDIHAAPAVP